MSREAIEAVQDYSQCSDSISISVFTAIARFIQIGPNGWIDGWVSLREMARIARCDKDTAAARVKHLEELGEIVTRKEGAGRGTKIWFTLLLPVPERDNSQVLSHPERDNKHTDNNALMSQNVALLSQQIKVLSQQIELLSQRMSDNVPTVQVVEKNNTITPNKEHQEQEEEKTPPSPHWYMKPLDNSKESLRIKALCTVCNLDPDIPMHRSKAEKAADQISKYTPEYILERYSDFNGKTSPGKWNWYADDWRGKKGTPPTADQVVETITQKKYAGLPAPIGGKQEAKSALTYDPLMPKPGQGGIY